MAWDVLEWGGLDRLQEPLEARRAHLEGWLAARGEAPAGLEISTPLAASSWQALAALRQACRAHAAEGLMLKRRGSPYRAGRRRGDWWKWKIEPMTFDGVLLYAQVGHGRRANLYTDYTFGVWEGDTLVPIAKAYSGLTDEEIRKVDHWVRRHTREKFGPVRSVEAGLVFEVGFEGIAASTRHKAGLAVRFPRMLRWRTDKAPADADTLEQVRRWLDVCGAHARGDAEDADG
jgi:DNA ligase-1